MSGKFVVVAVTAALALACLDFEEESTSPSGQTAQNPPGTGTSATYATPEQVLSAAPPVWRPQGQLVERGGVSFVGPADWQATVYTDEVVSLTSPPDASGERCEIFVMPPRPTPAGEDAKYQLVLDATTALFPAGTEMGEGVGRPYPLEDKWRGRTGRGWDYYGLVLTADGTIQILAFIADFGGTSVPVVVIESNQSEWDCTGIMGELEVLPATVFHSLNLANYSPAAGDANWLAQAALGEWFSTDGTAGTLYVFGANGNYVDAYAYGGTVETSPGDWSSQYATWAGDGSYVIRGDVLGLFPTGEPASSHYIHHYEEVDLDGIWSRKLCMISSFESKPYSICYDRK